MLCPNCSQRILMEDFACGASLNCSFFKREVTSLLMPSHLILTEVLQEVPGHLSLDG
jgi:hypothetical protein